MMCSRKSLASGRDTRPETQQSLGFQHVAGETTPRSYLNNRKRLPSKLKTLGACMLLIISMASAKKEHYELNETIVESIGEALKQTVIDVFRKSREHSRNPVTVFDGDSIREIINTECRRVVTKQLIRMKRKQNQTSTPERTRKEQARSMPEATTTQGKQIQEVKQYLDKTYEITKESGLTLTFHTHNIEDLAERFYVNDSNLTKTAKQEGTTIRFTAINRCEVEEHNVPNRFFRVELKNVEGLKRHYFVEGDEIVRFAGIYDSVQNNKHVSGEPNNYPTCAEQVDESANSVNSTASRHISWRKRRCNRIELIRDLSHAMAKNIERLEDIKSDKRKLGLDSSDESSGM